MHSNTLTRRLVVTAFVIAAVFACVADLYSAPPMPAEPEAQPYPYKKATFYDLPSRMYNIWQKPDEVEWGAAQRCRPRPFCPRGYGDLGLKRTSSYRLDYHRYVIRDPHTIHGPSYYPVSTTPQKCCELECGRCDCDTCRSKRGLRLFRR